MEMNLELWTDSFSLFDVINILHFFIASAVYRPLVLGGNCVWGKTKHFSRVQFKGTFSTGKKSHVWNKEHV